jgi:hypothetical protein
MRFSTTTDAVLVAGMVTTSLVEEVKRRGKRVYILFLRRRPRLGAGDAAPCRSVLVDLCEPVAYRGGPL